MIKLHARRFGIAFDLARALVVGGALASISAAGIAQEPTSGQRAALRQACRVDFQAQCAGTVPGGREALECLTAHRATVSPACQKALGSLAGDAGGRAQAQGAQAPGDAGGRASAQGTGASGTPGAQPARPEWPHVVQGAAGTATIYQPQVISWPDQRTLNTRIALGITPNGATAPVFGTIEVSFATATSVADRTVVLSDARLTTSRFPSVDTTQAVAFEERIRNALAAMGSKRYPLDTLLASMPPAAPPAAAVPLRNQPPTIFVATGNASLVVFDGEPVMAPVAGTALSFAVNTNWDVFYDGAGGRWYLLVNGGWLAATAVNGPWAAAGKLPADFNRLPADAGFADVKKQVPGRTLAATDVPVVFVSTTPAEIIVTNGTANYAAVPGTRLQYLVNSDAVVFRDSADGRVYFLVSGRWFAAPGLAGPWTFATPTLPADFARIPPDGPRGWVRASIPGTPEAQQALAAAQVPHQASLDRSKAQLSVTYAGIPKFEPIPGTPLIYAVNTSFDVIGADDRFYACYQGAWFVADNPNGPWALAASVPAVIYTIPPASPLYRVTFVKVYDATPEYVTYGYTSGYTMAYVDSGVVVYGTGWYYPPVVIPAPIPIYYPYPYSFAGAVYYNPATGAWARGGAIYGPYGGVAKAGTAYNPATGAWAHGGAVYGPYGGAGAVSAYNPSTGGYFHGSAVWGPEGGSASANWYNPRTGISGSTTQNANAYGRWGSSTLTGPNQTVHTQSASNARGSAASFSSSSGAKGAAVSGAGGNTAGAVKTSSGQVYAGADGNVYKKTDDGWEKYDNGSWNSVGKSGAEDSPAARAQQGAQQRTAAAGGQGAAPSAAQGAAGQREAAAGSEGRFGQLDQDHAARMEGMDRQGSSSWAQGRGAERGGQFGGAERGGRFGGGRGGRR